MSMYALHKNDSKLENVGIESTLRTSGCWNDHTDRCLHIKYM